MASSSEALSALVLDELGRVVLPEGLIDTLQYSGKAVTAGANGFCNNGQNTSCSNTRCDYSSNSINCSNFNCTGSMNPSRCV